MAYCDLDDIKNDISEDELIQLTDDVNAGVVDEDKVTDAIADADSEIDSYAMVLYDVPFNPVPRVIKNLSVGIAIYYLFQRRQMINEAVKERYDNAIKFLERLSKDKVRFAKDDGSEPSSADAQVEIESQDRVFDREKLKGF